MERTGAVILAAGLSSRMHEFKPLLELGDSTIIVRAIENLKTAGASPSSGADSCVCCGAEERAVPEDAAPQPVIRAAPMAPASKIPNTFLFIIRLLHLDNYSKPII